MIKTTSALLLLLALQGFSNAQSTEIEGVWKMYETSFAGEPYGGERSDSEEMNGGAKISKLDNE